MPQTKQGVGSGNDPPNPRPLTPSVGPNTRHTTRIPTSSAEIEAMWNSVMDTASAEAFLSYKLLCHRNEAFTLAHLTSILFHITQMSANIPLPVTTAIRAVAFILKKHTACEIAKAAAEQLASDLVPQLTAQLKDSLSLHTTDLQATTERLANLAQQADNTLVPTVASVERLHKLLKDEHEEKEDDARIAADRIEEAVNKLQSSVEEHRATLKSLAPSLTATQDRINQLSAQLLSPPQQPSLPPSSQPSYSSIVASHLPPSVDKAVGHAAIRAREILLEPQPNSTLFPPNTSNSDIAKKLKTALATIRTDSTPPGDIRSVAPLRNGGLVVELESEHLALWLGGVEGRALLEGHFDSAVSFRNRTFPIVLEYLPIHLQIEQTEFLRKIEEENCLPTDTLSSIRWIKPPLRHSQTQRKAFALLQVSTASYANDILRDGICIDSERFAVRKDRKEPTRCAKCQRYGHIARNCTASLDTCGTCSGDHRTTQNCPEFIRRCDLLNEKFPENRMPYFPTELAWTHAIQPPPPPKPPLPTSPSPSTTSPPARRSKLINANLRQTTISYPPQSKPSTTRIASSSPQHPNPSTTPDFHRQSVDLLKDLYPPSDFGFGNPEPSTPNAFDSPASSSFATAHD
ncbi:hypothetical protein CY34DRAFT_97858 [Suillus luteus UH-Slu-Lm8-n1]|uniref:CCHC-type domain-containing protein n=1 Tax=Suillus luteus UH-Slu-Lm8-n1 TaxID=930992 RepID=A0A0C9ZYK8_9AGAM|nr:hypothetical protein CY34DRAFT_97858 [Suillus luteus UH-Slu-Lm8-n1]